MNESTTSNTSACISCGDPSLDPAGVETNCQSDRCVTRIAEGWGFSLEKIHELALEENRIRKYNVVTTENLLFYLAQTQIDRDAWRDRSLKSVEAGDSRLNDLWRELWDALEGDVDRDGTWSLIVDSVDGAPDLREEEVSGTITLTFSFSDLKIPGGLQYGERDDAIIEAYLEDASFDQDEADNTEVEED